MLGQLTRKRGEDRAALPPKKEGEEEGGEGTLVGTTATSTSPGRILLSRMGVHRAGESLPLRGSRSDIHLELSFVPWQEARRAALGASSSTPYPSCPTLRVLHPWKQC